MLKTVAVYGWAPFFVSAAFFIINISLVSAAETCAVDIRTDLRLGVTSSDVTKLQVFLNKDPRTQIALVGPGSPGQETEFFGAMTKKAVIAFQELHAADILAPAGLTKGTGFVGNGTRAFIETLCSLTSNAGATVLAQISTDALSVSTGEQPASSIAPAGALYVPFTSFNLTAGAKDVTVREVVVTQAGFAHDRSIDYLSLLNEAGEELSFAYIRSDHTAHFKDEFVVPAGVTLHLTVAAGMATELADYEGEMPRLRVDTIDASSPVTGALPIFGSFHTVNSTLALGTVEMTLSPFDPGVDRTRYVTEKEVIFSGVRISAGSKEALKLYSLTWQQNGSASVNDIVNVRGYIDGKECPMTIDDRYYTVTCAEGIDIDKGRTIDAHIKGDIGGTGSNRTVRFDIEDATSVYVIGQMYNFALAPYPIGNTGTTNTSSAFITEDGTVDTGSLSPYFQGSTLTILPGASFTITR